LRLVPAPPPEAEVEALHEASLRLLAEVGVRIPSRRALHLLHEAGAEVNAEAELVRFPRRLVEEAVARAPRDVLLAGRDPSYDVRLGEGRPCLLTLDGTGAATLDHRTGERRASTLRDLAEATLVADHEPEIGVVWNIVTTADTPANARVLVETDACLRHTGKHVQAEVQRAEEVPYVLDLLGAVAAEGRWDPSRPFFSIVYCPVSPLQHEPEMAEAAMALASEGVPMCLYSMGLAGATTPVTLAGSVMQSNAEILSALVLFQVLNPGLPCIYVADTGLMDLQSGLYRAAPPEAVLVTQAMVALGRRYGLPVMASGLTSDAPDLGHASGVEAALTCLPSLLMEPDLFVGAGMLDAAQLLSLPKILLDVELFRACRRVLDGLVVDDEHLMVDVAAAVGPGGHFLGARETRAFLRNGEIYRARHRLRETGAPGAAPALDEVARAAEAIDAILATHRPVPLPAGAEARVEEILAAAEAELPER
jgi:trimethylamine--corrinoid protein Co-methyltransferase